MSFLSRLFGRAAPTPKRAPIQFTNTLTGRKEVFSPQKPGQVLMYSCGPTVYAKQHIGNMRAAIFSDLIARVLREAGLTVHKVVNITDVGHLVSDADEGEDKMEVGARREGRSAKDIAEQYTRAYLEDLGALNIDTHAIQFPRATDFMKEQIEMVRALEERGLTYRTTDGIYFDTAQFAAYGKLGNVADSLRKEYALADIGRRISENKEKRRPADFALWKFSPSGGSRLQEWPSPWGVGFPGWHLECSAMARALLGPTLDIHTGGMDHIPVHHNNEIAQSESLTGKPLARYWLHNAFLTIEHEKVSKSLGNDVYVSDVTARGYHPLALRYFFLQAHYRSPENFTWEALAAADEALRRLWRLVADVKREAKGKSRVCAQSQRMSALLHDDLATPAALALLWECLKDEDLDAAEVWSVIEAAEPVLGLTLLTPPETARGAISIPSDVQELVSAREIARRENEYARADELRIHIEERGYHVEDGPNGTIVTKKRG